MADANPQFHLYTADKPQANPDSYRDESRNKLYRLVS